MHWATSAQDAQDDLRQHAFIYVYCMPVKGCLPSCRSAPQLRRRPRKVLDTHAGLFQVRTTRCLDPVIREVQPVDHPRKLPHAFPKRTDNTAGIVVDNEPQTPPAEMLEFIRMRLQDPATANSWKSAQMQKSTSGGCVECIEEIETILRGREGKTRDVRPQALKASSRSNSDPGSVTLFAGLTAGRPQWSHRCRRYVGVGLGWAVRGMRVPNMRAQ